MGRPRKYATNAERQAAHRSRWGHLSVDVETETAATVAKIAEFYDVSQSEVISQALKFAFLNHAAFQMTGVAFPFKHLRKQNPEGINMPKSFAIAWTESGGRFRSSRGGTPLAALRAFMNDSGSAKLSNIVNATRFEIDGSQTPGSIQRDGASAFFTANSDYPEENPLVRVRVKSPPQRPAGNTAAPSKRLVKRRKVTAKAPKGVYANPSPGFLYAVWRLDANKRPAYFMRAERSLKAAKEYAQELATKGGVPYGIVKKPL